MVRDIRGARPAGLHILPIQPWAGLGVLAAWAAAALIIGGVVFRLRDA